MIDIIRAVKKALHDSAALTAVIATGNIFITPDENLIPSTVVPPAIGIKDIGLSREISETFQSTKISFDQTYSININIYNELSDGEAVITSTSSGLLALTTIIHSVLHQNRLDSYSSTYAGVAGIYLVYSESEGPIEWMMGEDLNLLRKRISYTYKQRESL